MHGEKPNKEQENFREIVRATRSCISGRGDCEIHHPAGRTAKVHGVGNIGHWFLLPMQTHEHRLVDQGADGLETLQSMFMGYQPMEMVWDLTLHDFEKYLYQRVLNKIDRDKWPPDEVVEAIMNG